MKKTSTNTQIEGVVKNTSIPKIYLDTNGITVKCEGCEVGYKGILNGEEYEVVDNETLRSRVKKGVRLDRVVTTLVTDMSYMFLDSKFNQPIGNWDVSSVTNMSEMFSFSEFNQPIDGWVNQDF